MSLRGAIGRKETVRPTAGYMREWLATTEGTAVGTVLVLATVMVSALALRLYRLDSGLWLDEILMYVNYARLPLAEIATTYDSQNQHILYSLLARVSLLGFGDSGWSIRLPAVVFGVASICVAYLLGQRVASRREALLCAALLAFSYHHVWFSQNARGYTAILFFTLLSSWLLLLGLDEPSRTRVWVGYALAAALGVYVHLSMLFVVGGQLLTYAYAIVQGGFREGGRDHIARPLIGFGLAGCLILLLYAPVIPQLAAGQAGVVRGSAVASVWKSPLWSLLEMVRGLRVGFAGTVGALAAGALALAGAWGHARRRSLLLPLFAFPIALCAIAIIGLRYHVWPRFFFFAVGFGALLLIHGIFVVSELIGRHYAILANKVGRAATVAAVAIILGSAASVPAAYGPKQDYEGALEYISAAALPGDRVAVAGLATMPLKEYYGVDWPVVEGPTSLDAVRSGASRIWLVYTLPIHLRANYPELAAIIDQEFEILKVFHGTLHGGEVVVCLSDTSAMAADVREFERNETDFAGRQPNEGR